MLALANADRVLRSGTVVVDTARRQLSVSGRPVALGGLPLTILELLMAADGRILTRAELKRALWPYAARIDTERRLNTAVRALREALGDTAAEPRLILTVRGCGYRWIGHEHQQPHSRRPMIQGAAIAALCLLSLGPVSAPRQARPAAPDIAAAQAAIAGDWNWPAAETRFRGALNSHPAAAHRGLAWLYVNAGRDDDAMPHIAALLEAPTNGDSAELGWLLLRAGQPQAALAVCNASQEQSLNLLSCRQTALARLGLVAQARTTAVEIMRVADADPAAIEAVAGASPGSGYARFLRWRVGHFVPPTGDWFRRAQLEAEAGLYRDALASLDRALAERDPLLVKIGSTREFAPLRGSTEFRRIEAAVFAKARWS